MMEFLKKWYLNGFKFGVTVIIASIGMVSLMEWIENVYNNAF